MLSNPSQDPCQCEVRGRQQADVEAHGKTLICSSEKAAHQAVQMAVKSAMISGKGMERYGKVLFAYVNVNINYMCNCINIHI